VVEDRVVDFAEKPLGVGINVFLPRTKSTMECPRHPAGGSHAVWLQRVLIDDVRAAQFTDHVRTSLESWPEVDRHEFLRRPCVNPRGAAGECQEVEAFHGGGQRDQRQDAEALVHCAAPWKGTGDAEQHGFAILGKHGQGVERVLPDVGVVFECSQGGRRPLRSRLSESSPHLLPRAPLTRERQGLSWPSWCLQTTLRA
jgi:hypothetical protein